MSLSQLRESVTDPRTYPFFSTCSHSITTTKLSKLEICWRSHLEEWQTFLSLNRINFLGGMSVNHSSPNVLYNSLCCCALKTQHKFFFHYTYGELRDLLQWSKSFMLALYPLILCWGFFKLVVMWPLLSLLPFFISLRSSVPAPQAFKNPKYFIFPLASNRFQTPPFPALSLFLLLI